MPRNGSGVYSLPGGSTITNGDTSDASDVNTPLADIVTDLNAARPIVAGGTGATSASAALVNFGLTATAAELNTLDGITATVSELNILDGVTATATELNALDGITATVTELNYTDGVTSAIQTQLDAKAPLASPALTGTPTAPTAAAGTDSTQIATTAFVADAAIGIGQTWQELSGSRSAGVSYQNTTGRPIMVNILFTGSTLSLQVSSDNVTFIEIGKMESGTASVQTPASAIIPPSWYYKVDDGTIGTKRTWVELR